MKGVAGCRSPVIPVHGAYTAEYIVRRHASDLHNQWCTEACTTKMLCPLQARKYSIHHELRCIAYTPATQRAYRGTGDEHRTRNCVQSRQADPCKACTTQKQTHCCCGPCWPECKLLGQPAGIVTPTKVVANAIQVVQPHCTHVARCEILTTAASIRLFYTAYS